MKYVALDIGNVLFHCDFNPFLKTLSKSLNITLEDAQYFLGRTQKLHDLGYTVMADELRDHFHLKSPVIIEEILVSWNSSVDPDLDILNELDDYSNNDNLQIALLSNIGLEHAAQVESLFKEHNILQKCIKHFSCFVGARKPSSLFYQSFLMEHPEYLGCLYIDDVQENLDTGKRFGFNSKKFSLETDPEGLLTGEIDNLVRLP